MIRTLRSLACLLALGLGAGLAACETTPPPPAPVAVYVPPPPPPLPTVGVSQGVLENAAVFQAYMQRASAIRGDFQQPQQVAERLQVGQAFQAGQIGRGVVAYGAVVALQDRTFVETIRSFGRDPAQRAELVQRLLADPGYAASFEGSASAAGLVIAALQSQSQTLYDAGYRVKLSAYSTQRLRPFTADVPGRPERLRLAQAVALQPLAADPMTVEPLRAAALGTSPLGLAGNAVSPPYTPVVARALAIAALSALGEAEGANAQAIEALLSERSAVYCLDLSKLTFFQCLAAAKPYYEDLFCLGEHVMIDTAQCVARSIGRPIATPATVSLTTATNLTPVSPGAVQAAAQGATPAVASQAAPLATSAPVALPGPPAPVAAPPVQQPTDPSQPVAAGPRT